MDLDNLARYYEQVWSTDINMATDKSRIQGYVRNDLANWLLQLAQQENRSVSNLLEVILDIYKRQGMLDSATVRLLEIMATQRNIPENQIIAIAVHHLANQSELEQAGMVDL